MSREEAARLAFALIRVENQLDRGGSAGYRERLRRFVLGCAGTEAAALAEIDLIDLPTSGRARTVGYSGATLVLEKVDGVWRAVPLTRWWIT